MTMSSWLLAFSLFMFLSLALAKRCTELSGSKGWSRGRGYHSDDLPLLQTMGVASGFLSVLVFALYIDSPETVVRYGHPALLWGICPLLLYWLSRMWLKASRGQMHDDPVVFAMRDRISRAVAVGIVGLVVAAYV